MLQQINFYVLKDFSNTETGKFIFHIILNPEHDIFKGHFPGSPVVPGVCLIQITKEVVEKALGYSTLLLQSSQTKFLAVVDPNVDVNLQLALEIKEADGQISVNSIISSGEKIFFKFKGTFKRIQ